jgi:hypothetical protein
MNTVLPLSTVTPPSDKFPLAVKLLINVIVVVDDAEPYDIMSFQVIPFDVIVVEVVLLRLPMFNVEPVVTTVPAV